MQRKGPKGGVRGPPTHFASLDHFPVENAPTCNRALRWPDQEFQRKIPQKYPGLKFWTPRISPQNTQNYRKIPPKYRKNALLGVFSEFGGFFLGFQNFGPGLIFSAFFVEFRVGPSRGSVADQGVLNFPDNFCNTFLRQRAESQDSEDHPHPQ